MDESEKERTAPVEGNDFSLDPEWNHAYLELVRYGGKKQSIERALIVVDFFRKQGKSVLNFDLVEEFKVMDDGTQEVKLQLFWREHLPKLTDIPVETGVSRSA